MSSPSESRSSIIPAVRAYAEDGTPCSPAYGDVYHSADGGLAQARHVFLGGNALPERWTGRRRFSILETGFGFGLNFLATWEAWRRHGDREMRLHFVSVEKHPFERDDLAALLARWSEFAPLAAPLVRAWPPLLEGFHRLEFEGGRVVLTLLMGDALRLLPRLDARIDAFYLDGFSPDRNPELWSDELFAQLARLAAPGATLATWSVASSVRERLQQSGYAAEKRPGFGRKREMLAGVHRGPSVPVAQPAARHAAVIGAGMTGASVAERLAARGWQVDLVERHPGPAREASGNPTGVLLPLINLSDTPGARLSRACLLHAGRRFASLPGQSWRPSGVLQLAKDERDMERHREIFERLGFPEDFARPVDRAEATALAGHPVATEGWWFPRGGWVSPAPLCEALLVGHEERIRLHFAREALSLEREAEGWSVRGAGGTQIARAPLVVLAGAARAAQFAPELPLHAVRGQVTLLPRPEGRDLRVPVCRRGYITPAVEGFHCLGATFDHEVGDARPRDEDHRRNLEKLEAMLPGYAGPLDASRLQGRVAFRATTPDRVPLLGPVPGAPGVWAAAGLGARGLVWAPLLAEMLASRLDGDPAPVERGLYAALDPARFARRRA